MTPTDTPVGTRGPEAYARGALAGLLAAAAALGTAEFAAAFLRPQAAPVITIGGAVIDRTPASLREWAIRQFGTNDKTFLKLSIAVLLFVFAAVVGVLAVRWFVAGPIGVALLGGFAIAAAVSRPIFRFSDVWPAVVGALAGAGVLVLLLRPRGRAAVIAADRRWFLAASGGVLGVSVVAGWLGRLLEGRNYNASASRNAVRLPAPASPLPPPAPEVDVPGVSPYLTPVGDFYRVDTALVVPQISTDSWRLRIHGMVDHPIELTYTDLLARPAVEREITLCCVSNPVGGPYIGNAQWLGTPLADILREAGVQPGADQLVSRSDDGMTIGTPVAAVLDGRDALLVYGMDGEPLPFEHGFPVRMVVPGLYGYVSACKWLTDLELTTFASFDAYWVQNGWSQQAVIKTESRIDTPRGFTKLKAGRVPVAGVAWAQHRGIAKVEVQVDSGPWQEAQLSQAGGLDTWKQWVWYWDATPGNHALAVRATDATGQTQTATVQDVVPDGATGYHTVSVSVS